MSRTIFTIIVAILLISVSCDFKFLERRINKHKLAGFNPAELVAIYTRFINGTQIFANIEDQEACDINSYPEILGDFIYIVNSIKQFDIEDDAAGQVVDILKHLEDIIPRLQGLNERCDTYQAKAMQKLNDLKAYLLKPQYLITFLSHTMLNMADLTTKYKHLYDELTDENFTDAAADFGALLRETAFWDFK